MARFVAKILNERGNEVHRLGHHSLDMTLNGWDSGIFVQAVKRDNNVDEFRVYITKGSNNSLSWKLFAIIVNGEQIF